VTIKKNHKKIELCVDLKNSDLFRHFSQQFNLYIQRKYTGITEPT
jgi:hypothetical protein